MKKFYLLSLPLAAAMVMPAAAQQQPSSNPQDQSQPAETQPAQTQPVQQTDQSAPSATGKEPLKYERHEGFWGHLMPFARKKYTQRQLQPIRGRVNEWDELTAKNARMIADVDTRATEGIRQALSIANDDDTHALDPGNRANHAQHSSQQATTRLGTEEEWVTTIGIDRPLYRSQNRFRP